MAWWGEWARGPPDSDQREGLAKKRKPEGGKMGPAEWGLSSPSPLLLLPFALHGGVVHVVCIPSVVVEGKEIVFVTQ
jgi:hypothetical protein